ncbi:MAG: TIGR04283 family arsenosugar biosynthesis glycosyltransferase [Candidatus Aquicultor sp.]
MISVIIPVLNEEAALPAFLHQFKDIEGDFELLICDGGSTDSTVEVVQTLDIANMANIKLIEVPRGRARQMNVGAQAALGDILLFLHADTNLDTNALTSIEDAMRDTAVAGGRFKVKLDNPAAPYRMIGVMINVRDGIFGGFTGDQAIFVRKSVFKAMGGFKEIELCEDIDLAVRLKDAGKVIRLRLYAVTAARRWEKKGLARTILLMWLIRLLFYARVSPKKLAAIYADVR